MGQIIERHEVEEGRIQNRREKESHDERERNNRDGCIRRIAREQRRERKRGSKHTRSVNVDLLFRIQSQKRGDQSIER